ncbi:MAG: tetratricopeptide repeat protein [Ekhidna sp.]|uniref:tetratricopeptide repeat-containing sensor histidine kinase n=1 Tax=Ekhidna sp. TaxID=2608089 RepID=UPI0032EBB339
MTKHWISVSIFLLVFSQCLVGQSPQIDSLTQALSELESDTNRVHTLRKLGQALRSYDREKTLEYLNESLTLARQLKFSNGEIEALYSIGLTYGMAGDYANALTTLAQCEELAIQINDHDRLVFINNSRGIIYKRLGDYPASRSYYLKNLQLVDSLGLDVNTSSVYSNLGILYDLMDEKQKALDAYKKAIEVHKGPGLEDLKKNAQVNIAVMEYEDGNYESALMLFLESIKDKEDRMDNTTAFSNVGLCYMQLKNWEEAEKYLNKSVALSSEMSLKREEAIGLRNLSELMLKQGRLAEAEDYYKMALELMPSYGFFQWKKQIHELAFFIHRDKGELQKAIDHLEQSIVYKDSLFNESKMKEIQNMELQHNVYMKNQEIIQQQSELTLLNEKVALENRRKTLLAVITLLSVFSFGLLVYGYRRKIRSNALLKEKNKLISSQKARIEEMNEELEKRMLRAQMNPHFIFNSLNSIQHFITANDKTAALSYLTKFSKLLRQVLESSIDVNVILEDEIKLLKIYVELEALRFDDSFSYEFIIDDKLDTYAHEIPILLVQPYIENAIIHGLIPKQGDKRLTITFEDAKEYIKCIIEDNGVGRKGEETRASGKHISRGMSVTEQRIRSLEKTNYQLVIIDDLEKEGKSAGTRVTVAIPKN